MSTTTKTLAEKVAAYKLIARDSLRAELISARQSKVAHLEEHVADLNQNKADLDLDMKVEVYEISKLDTEHPLFDKTKAAKEETVKFITERLESNAKMLEETNKAITEQNEAIAKIESGETKVSLERLNALVEDMVRQNALNQTSTIS